MRRRLVLRGRSYYVTHQARRTIGAWIGLLALLIFFSLASPIFLTGPNLTNVLGQASNILIVAAGITVVLIVGEIDLAVASIESFAGAFLAVLVIKNHLPLAPGLIVALGASAGIGLVSGLAVSKLEIPSFIITLAMLGIAVGIAYLITAGNPILGFPNTFQQLGQGKIGRIPYAAILAFIILLATQLMLNHTRLGRHMLAVGGNREAAEMSGIPVGRVKASALVISGLFSGIGGLILASRLNSGFGGNGSSDLINVIAAAVIGGASLFGGAGSMWGVLAGGLVVGCIYNGMVLLNIGEYWNQVVLGIAILGATLVDQISTGSGPLGVALAARLKRSRGEPRRYR